MPSDVASIVLSLWCSQRKDIFTFTTGYVYIYFKKYTNVRIIMCRFSCSISFVVLILMRRLFQVVVIILATLISDSICTKAQPFGCRKMCFRAYMRCILNGCKHSSFISAPHCTEEYTLCLKDCKIVIARP